MKASQEGALIGSVRYFGDYELIEEIARGGMGIVFRARQVSLNRAVALKMILAGQFADSESLRRFQAEAEAVAHLDHPNIVPIYEIGQHEGRHYFSMKLVEGGSLAHKISNFKSQISNRDAATLLVKVARAVHHGHQRGILHRDLKPANILLEPSGEPHVTDFGLAKRIESESDLTRSGAVMGTPNYMAPEQAAGRSSEVTTAADVFSLGAIFYHLLTGQPPFRAETPIETLRKVLEQEPERPRNINRRVNPDLETICCKCLEKDARRRYGTAESLAEDLERWLRHEPIQARPSPPWKRTFKWIRRKPAVAALLAVIGMVAGLGAFGILRQWLKTEYSLYLNRVALAERYWAANDLRGASALLESCWEPFRAFEWHYVKALLNQRLLSIRTESGDLHDVKFSPDGKLIVAASGKVTREPLPSMKGEDIRSKRVRVSQVAGGQLTVWDAETGGHVKTLEGGGGPFTGLAFSLDGSQVATSSTDDRVTVWNLPNGHSTVTLAGNGKGVSKVLFHPDGRCISSSNEEGTIKFWNTSTGEELFKIRETGLQTIAISPDGKQLAVVSDRVTIRDPWNGREISTLRQTTPRATAIAFSPDGRTLAVGDQEGRVLVLESVTGQLMLSILTHASGLNCVCFSPDGGYLATGGSDGLVKVFLSSTGRESLVLRGHDKEAVRSIAYSPDGLRLVSGDVAGHVLVWDASQSRESLPLASGGGNRLRSFAFSPDGTKLVWNDGGSKVRVWDLEKGRELSFLNGKLAVGGFVRFASIGHRIVSIGNEQTLDGKLEPVTKLLDATSGKELHTLRGQHFRLLADAPLVAASRDAKWLAFTRDGKSVTVWDVVRDREVVRTPGFSIALHALALSPDGQRVAAAGNAKEGDNDSCEVKVWDVVRGGEGRRLVRNGLRTLGRHGSAASLAFSEDGRTLAMGDIVGNVTVWAAPSGRERFTTAGHVGSVESVAFRADGRQLASAGKDRTIKLWNTETGQEVLTLRGHAERIWSVAYSPDGLRLASASADGTIRLWPADDQPPHPYELAYSVILFKTDGTGFKTIEGTVLSGVMLFAGLAGATGEADLNGLNRPARLKVLKVEPDAATIEIKYVSDAGLSVEQVARIGHQATYDFALEDLGMKAQVSIRIDRRLPRTPARWPAFYHFW